MQAEDVTKRVPIINWISRSSEKPAIGGCVEKTILFLFLSSYLGKGFSADTGEVKF